MGVSIGKPPRGYLPLAVVRGLPVLKRLTCRLVPRP